MDVDQQADIARTLRLFFAPGDVFEIRALTTVPRLGTVSGYFDDIDRAVAAVAELDGASDIDAIYVTLNPVDPALLGRAKNKTIVRAKDTTTDAQIVRRKRLLIDLDPKRPKGTSSTDPQHAAGLARARQVAAFLHREADWPWPIVASSGNGYHLLYAIDLPNEPGSDTLLRRVLQAIARAFPAEGDLAIDVDVKVFNAARITKLYGTQTRKGDPDDTDRPHRRSALLSVPEPAELLPVAALEALARTIDDEPASRPFGERTAAGYGESVAELLARWGVAVKSATPYIDGTKFVLSVCPFNPEHNRGEAVVIESPGNKRGFTCHHNSCAGYHWADLREKFEPGYRETGQGRNWRDPRSKAGNGRANGATASEFAWIGTAADAIVQEDMPDVSWMCVPLLERENGPLLMFGDPDSGKTWLALDLAIRAVTGGLFLGKFPVFPFPGAAYVNFDAGGLAMRRRVAKFALQARTAGAKFTLYTPGEFDPRQFELCLKQHAGGFVVADCLADMYAPDPKKEQGQSAREFIRWLRSVYAEYGCGGVIIDHTNRAGGDFYGSQQKLATFRQMWKLTNLSPDRVRGEPLRVQVTCRKMSEEERFASFAVGYTFDESGVVYGVYQGDVKGDGPAPEGEASMSERVYVLLETAGRAGVTRGHVEEHAGLSKQGALKQLRKLATLINGRWYLSQFAPPESDTQPEPGVRETAETDPNRPRTPDTDPIVRVSGVRLDSEKSGADTVSDWCPTRPCGGVHVGPFYAPCELCHQDSDQHDA